MTRRSGEQAGGLTVLVPIGAAAERHAAQLLRRADPPYGAPLVMTYDLDRPGWLDGLAVDWRSAQRYLAPEECEAIDAFALTARTWSTSLVPGVEDITEWEGASLAVVLEYSMHLRMLETAKDALAIERLVAAEKPHRVIVVADTDATAAAYRCAVPALEITRVSPPAPRASDPPRSGRRWQHARALAAAASGSLWLALVPRLRPACALVDDGSWYVEFARGAGPLARAPFVTVWPPAGAPSDDARSWRIRVVDPRWPRTWSGRLPLDRRAWSRGYAEARAVFVGRWASARQMPELRQRFVHAGLDLWPALEPHLARLFEHAFPVCAADLVSLRDLGRKAKAGVVVINDDTVASARLMAHAARQRGIRSVYYMRGLLLHAYSGWGLRLTDICATWGPGFADVAARHGGDPARVRPVGPPQRVERIARGARRPGPSRVVFLQQKDGDEWDGGRFTNYAQYPTGLWRSLLRLACLAAQREPAWRLIVKCHPREDEEAVRRELGRYASTQAEVVTGVSFEVLLLDADVALTQNSTAGLVALGCGIPLIQLDLPGTREISLFAQEGAALRATTVEELRGGVDLLTGDASAREQLMERAAAYVARYASPGDGKSFERFELLVAEELARARCGAAARLVSAPAPQTQE